MPENFMSSIGEVGLAITLIGIFFLPLAWFFIRRDQARERSMCERLDQREADVRAARLAHIGDLKDIVQNNTKAVQELSQTLGRRPCLLHQEKENENV